MARTLEELRDAALQLPPDEQRMLAEEIFQHLVEVMPRFSAEQMAEWRRRLDDLESGHDPGLTVEQFFDDSDLDQA